MFAGWAEGEAKPHLDWLQQFQAAIKPFASEGVYVNFTRCAEVPSPARRHQAVC
jgi:hypothetical protein